MPVGMLTDMDVRFDRGLDSFSDPASLATGNYAWGVNIINRGGPIQTRPGFEWFFSLPAGKLQGLATFVPTQGRPVLVAFVSGIGYVANYPYTKYREIQGAQMSADAEQVHFAQAVQSVQNNADGSLRLISPRQLLMCQDGLNPPAYFDGRILTRIVGLGNTPQGTYMAWAGARLWVARNNLLFASDLANPLSFLEQTYNTLGGVNYFTLPGNCTGLAPIPGAPNLNTSLLAFTQTSTSMFQSSILNRALWPTTSNFQAEIFPNQSVGCVSGKSLVALSGMLWWFSNYGVTRLDSAQSSALTTKIYRIDRELERSSSKLNSDLTRICAAAYENYVLMSVPYTDSRNKHTWVYDGSVNDLVSQNQVSYLTTAWSSVWASVWTGVCPVQWATVIINGVPRLFCASADDDGGNRVYESFTNSRRDTGCDIPWSFESRAYTAGTPLPKQFRFLHYSLSELQGQVNLRISWAGGARGRWKEISTPTFYAGEGNIDGHRIYHSSDLLYGLKKQSRIARTEDVLDKETDKLSSAGIEGLVEIVDPNKETVDTTFQFRIEGSGPCAIRSLVVRMDPVPASDGGQQSTLEKDKQFVRFDGAASHEEIDLDESDAAYIGVGVASSVWHNYAGTGEASIVSRISQKEADKRSAQIAQARADQYVLEIAKPYVAGKLVDDSS